MLFQMICFKFIFLREHVRTLSSFNFSKSLVHLWMPLGKKETHSEPCQKTVIFLFISLLKSMENT